MNELSEYKLLFNELVSQIVDMQIDKDINKLIEYKIQLQQDYKCNANTVTEYLNEIEKRYALIILLTNLIHTNFSKKKSELPKNLLIAINSYIIVINNFKEAKKGIDNFRRFIEITKEVIING